MAKGRGCAAGCVVVMAAPILLVVVWSLTQQVSTPRYRALEIPPLPGFEIGPRAVNDRLQVAGTLSSATQAVHTAFVWDPTQGYAQFTVPGADKVRPAAMSNTGWIVGGYTTSRDEFGRIRQSFGFIRDPTGNSIVHEDPSNVWMRIQHVNDRGTALILILAMTDSANGQTPLLPTGHYLRSATGELTPMELDFPRAGWVLIEDFSDQNEVLGKWRKDWPVPSAQSDRPFASGQMVQRGAGAARLAAPQAIEDSTKDFTPHYFVWSPQYGHRSILTATGETISDIFFQNDGTITGLYEPLDGPELSEFIWTPEGGIRRGNSVASELQGRQVRSFMFGQYESLIKKALRESDLFRRFYVWTGVDDADWLGLNIEDNYAILEGKFIDLNRFTDGLKDWKRVDLLNASRNGVIVLDQGTDEPTYKHYLLVPPGIDAP